MIIIDKKLSCRLYACILGIIGSDDNNRDSDGSGDWNASNCDHWLPFILVYSIK